MTIRMHLACMQKRQRCTSHRNIETQVESRHHQTCQCVCACACVCGLFVSTETFTCVYTQCKLFSNLIYLHMNNNLNLPVGDTMQAVIM